MRLWAGWGNGPDHQVGDHLLRHDPRAARLAVTAGPGLGWYVANFGNYTDINSPYGRLRSPDRARHRAEDGGLTWTNADAQTGGLLGGAHGCGAASCDSMVCRGRGADHHRCRVRGGRRAVIVVEFRERTPTVPADLEAVGDQVAAGVQALFDESPTGAYDNVRAVLVAVDGHRIVERYYESSAAATHNVWSVTKSVMSMLVGIALEDGHIDSVDQTLAELLPSYADHMSPQTEAITLQQVLTMTAGLPTGADEEELATTRDWVAAMLDASPVSRPGRDFAYSNPGSHLLSAILVEATGQPVLEYAREQLFSPLGIVTDPAAEPVMLAAAAAEYAEARFAWPTDPAGLHTGWCCLKLTARDMETLGQLWLDEGEWNGTQVVPAEWVAESTRPHVATTELGRAHYGYQWWVTEADGRPAFAAVGYDGQLVEIVPELDLVVVVVSEEGTMNVQSDALLSIVANVIAPAVRNQPR